MHGSGLWRRKLRACEGQGISMDRVQCMSEVICCQVFDAVHSLGLSLGSRVCVVMVGSFP